MAEHAFDKQPIEVSQAVWDGLKTIPTATIHNIVRYFKRLQLAMNKAGGNGVLTVPARIAQAVTDWVIEYEGVRPSKYYPLTEEIRATWWQMSAECGG